MESFRTELEDPVVARDILELERKIYAYRHGQIDEDRFRSLRLARGVYGQRQPGVQMVRIKLPFGKVTARQLRRIADVSDRYSNGNLHITTRQDVQIHYVSLDRTPELWAELERDDVTLREACGNTVRNVTASPMAGIDPAEPFDVSPYAQALFAYFLRNPICQDMGRKFKIAFSASAADDALAFVHDLGFIPRVEGGVRGFRVMLGGGIGAQPQHAELAWDFLPADRIIPFTEGVLRVFDRHGERLRRHKARLKYLVKELGMEAFMASVEAEALALPHRVYPIEAAETPSPAPLRSAPMLLPTPSPGYARWRSANVFPQKQEGYFAVGIKITNGDLHSDIARQLADVAERWAQDDLRFTIQQGILLRFVQEAHLPALHSELAAIGLAQAGYGSVMDIVACPGTDTCNLGIAGSTGLARELERLLEAEFPELISEKDLTIKISGCMNACSQHTVANIGFQGMTVKAGALVAPASQILLGGGPSGEGQGRFADKVLKVPARRSPEALRRLLLNFQQHRLPAEPFNAYYDRQGTDYFYQMLKDLSATDNLTQEDFTDWGNVSVYEVAIGVGECAGVTVDLVATLLFEAEEKLDLAEAALVDARLSDALYWAYTAMLYAAKGILTPTEAKMNTQAAIIREFDTYFTGTGEVNLGQSFHDMIYRINQISPNPFFAREYLDDARRFLGRIQELRSRQLKHEVV